MRLFKWCHHFAKPLVHSPPFPRIPGCGLRVQKPVVGVSWVWVPRGKAAVLRLQCFNGIRRGPPRLGRRMPRKGLNGWIGGTVHVGRRRPPCSLEVHPLGCLAVPRTIRRLVQLVQGLGLPGRHTAHQFGEAVDGGHGGKGLRTRVHVLTQIGVPIPRRAIEGCRHWFFIYALINGENIPCGTHALN